MKYFNTTHPIAILLLFITLFFALSSPVRAAEPEIVWTAHPAAEDNDWWEVTWSPELNLFVAVAGTGTNRVMTSPDGITWTARTAAAASWWLSVAWSPELDLFVAVAHLLGSPSQVMSSPDGINWTNRTAASGSWLSVTWSPELNLFVAVGITDLVITSPDGINWTTRTGAENNSWFSVTWSPELNLFVAVAEDGANRVMTSPDGINWTARTAAELNAWNSVAWSPELDLFVAVSYNGTNRVMTSPDGINWTARAGAGANQWTSVTWSPELNLFVVVAVSGTNHIMTSPDGINWTAHAAPEANQWFSVTWSPELDRFVAVSTGGTNRVMVGTVAPEITTTTLPNETIGVSYSQTIGTQYGRTPFTWSVTSGSLPPGLTLNTSTGEISGTPTAAGTFNFTVQVTDDAGGTDDQALAIIVEEASSSRGGGSGIRYGCKDESALNYNYFSSHKQSLCEYAEEEKSGKEKEENVIPSPVEENTASVVALTNTVSGNTEETSNRAESTTTESSIPAQLFDIRLFVQDQMLESAGELEAQITFTSFGREPTPVDITFSIIDTEEREVWRSESPDTIIVETEAVFTKDFTDLALPDGSYTLRLETLYNTNVEDTFEAPFSIVTEAGETCAKWWFLCWWWWIMIAVGGFAVWYVGWRRVSGHHH